METQGPETRLNYSRNDTNIAKGIAVILLLNHHLFFLVKDAPPLINGFSFVYFFANVSKVCVAIFVFLSGYGLSKSWKDESLLLFLKKRLIKFFLNYWIIWLLFVPVNILFFGRTLGAVYQDHILVKFLINFMSLQRFFDFYGYNPTWWFASLIIALYCLFPFIKILIDKYKLVSLLLTVPFLYIKMDIPVIKVDFLLPWLFPFALGIYSSNTSLLCSLKRSYLFSGKHRIIKDISIILILFTLMLYRQFGFILTGIRIDGLLGFVIILWAYIYIKPHSYLGRFLHMLGTHSFNIFLFHTFIYLYYFPVFFSKKELSIILLVVLLLTCLAISMAIEWLKNKISFYTLEQRLINPGLTKKNESAFISVSSVFVITLLSPIFHLLK